MTMDWLAENVIGYIPAMEELVEQAKPVVSTQGLGEKKQMEIFTVSMWNLPVIGTILNKKEPLPVF